jgi:hypothetical protein
MTPLTTRLQHYITMRRSLGYDLSFSERVLHKFCEFADSRSLPALEAALRFGR